ncbi:hypothetical protein FGE12_03150 [Aggregicoccus sp. 17bor-14]|uniref:hypothetical protein n=1 Tax=Myxococcaceae TaxID=31 RepID=UPI00129C5C92|nr:MULTISPECIES: hypothetical protein [Myxococcaceae]MBF5041370.1 hypothetical protein [Simulacricoccus sp. 17bor-14]MRI87154.1 hypothetical protein [Aggregicoccus sp. 17bor-14]
MNLPAKLPKRLKDLQKLDRDDLLEVLGLQERRAPSDVLLPAVGAFAVGVLVGAGLGLLLAPKAGRARGPGRGLAASPGGADAGRSTETPSAIASGARTL